MRPALSLLLVPVLAACQTAAPADAPDVAPGLPPEVAARLPADVPAGDVARDARGCWAYAFEGLTIPVTRDGIQICT